MPRKMSDHRKAKMAAEGYLGAKTGRTCIACSKPSLRYATSPVCVSHATPEDAAYSRAFLDLEADIMADMLPSREQKDHLQLHYIMRRSGVDMSAYPEAAMQEVYDMYPKIDLSWIESRREEAEAEIRRERQVQQRKVDEETKDYFRKRFGEED